MSQYCIGATHFRGPKRDLGFQFLFNNCVNHWCGIDLYIREQLVQYFGSEVVIRTGLAIETSNVTFGIYLKKGALNLWILSAA